MLNFVGILSHWTVLVQIFSINIEQKLFKVGRPFICYKAQRTGSLNKGYISVQSFWGIYPTLLIFCNIMQNKYCSLYQPWSDHAVMQVICYVIWYLRDQNCKSLTSIGIIEQKFFLTPFTFHLFPVWPHYGVPGSIPFTYL